MSALLAACEGGAVFAALWLLGQSVLQMPDEARWMSEFGLPLILALAAVSALYYAGCYDLRQVPSVGRLAPRLPRCAMLAALPLGAGFALHPHAGAILLAAVALMVSLPLAVRGIVYPVARRPRFVERVLIVGTGPLARQVAEAIEAQAGYRYRTVGMIDVPPSAESPTAQRRRHLGSQRLRALHDLDRVIESLSPDRIVVAPTRSRQRLPVQPFLAARSRGIAVEEGADFYERLTGKIAIEALTPWSLIHSRGFRPSRATRGMVRALSVVIAAVGLVATAPLQLLIALAVKLDSPGPVLFAQERVGLGGRRFTLLKFRTMRDQEGAPSEWAGDNAHRITRLGRWLRALRLDELPQFVNVLRGDMDVVGPRPHPGSNFSLFVTVLRNLPECGEEIPYYSLRSMVRPGITGWAQVRYRYANNLEEEIEKMRYDLYYVKHRSLWMDLGILAATVKTVLAGRGATAGAPARAAALSPASWRLAQPLLPGAGLPRRPPGC